MASTLIIIIPVSKIAESYLCHVWF